MPLDHDSRITRRGLFSGVTGTVMLTMAGKDSATSPTRPSPERKMHLGLVTYNVAKDWSLDTLLKNAKESGLEGIEFRTTHAHGVEPTLSQEARKVIKEKLAASGLKQFSLGTTCEFQSNDINVVKQNVQTASEFIKLASDIGARAVKVRPNGAPQGIPLEKTLEQIGTSLREIGKAGSDSGVEIWMEVHGGLTQLAPNSKKIMDYCRHPNVGVTWNSNNTDVVNGSVKENFELLKSHIRCCHITELWSGYPYRELFALLNGIGYDRFTLCEVGSSIRAEDGIPFLKCYSGLWQELSK